MCHIELCFCCLVRPEFPGRFLERV
uniref:Uncharacterized protein n=1 Tax=Anguilla anguilla TaxID=7936 RepID=A0A0E9VHD5_ANGAN